MARRESKRQAEKEIRSIINKAKSSMYSWMVDLKREPTEAEIRAWQAGYLSGLGHKEKQD